MEKNCVICGSKYEGTKSTKYCSVRCSEKAYRQRQNPSIAKYKDLKECPLLEKCKQISGNRLNCENRDFRDCDLFLNLLADKKSKLLRART